MHSTNSRVRDTAFTRGAVVDDGVGARSGGGRLANIGTGAETDDGDEDAPGNGLAVRAAGGRADDVDDAIDEVDDDGGDDGASKVNASWDFTSAKASPTQTPP